MGNKDFIRLAIEQVKPIIVDNGFQHIKLDMIMESLNISKSKFFHYFGSKMGIMDLVIYHEFAECYKKISHKVELIKDKDEFLDSIIVLRRNSIYESPLLLKYFETKALFTKQFEPLKESVLQSEYEFLNGIFKKFDFSQKYMSFITCQILREKLF